MFSGSLRKFVDLKLSLGESCYSSQIAASKNLDTLSQSVHIFVRDIQRRCDGVWMQVFAGFKAHKRKPVCLLELFLPEMLVAFYGQLTLSKEGLK